VKVDLSALAREQEEAEQLDRRRAEKQCQLEDEERQRLEDEERQRLEEATRQLEEQERRAERARRERGEREAREERERRREAERQEGEERKEALGTFCRRHGFVGISDARRDGCSPWKAATTYPLHTAAELADTRIVGMLLKEGVDPATKNSAGKTPAQLAQKKNRNGSHDSVQALLDGASKRRVGGA